MKLASGSRQEAIKALINTWLKDPKFYCGSCGEDYLEGDLCCEQPFIGDNQGVFKQFLADNKRIRETRANDYASNKDKSMRLGLSMPADLYAFLETAFENQYQEKLFNEEYDMRWFGKHFPMFCVPKKL